MTIIEFAHIKLLPGTTASSAELKSNMQRVKQVIENYSQLPTNFLLEHEDPSVMYVVGSWATAAQHARGFSGSLAQGEILTLVQTQLTIDWQHYVELAYPQVPLAAPVLSVATYLLRRAAVGLDAQQWAARKEEFHKVFAEPSRDFLDAVAAAEGLQGSWGGWNIAKEGEAEEDECLLWVQFSGWDTEASAKRFYASWQCQDLVKAVEKLGVETDVRHGSLYDLS